ncbi:MAG TPA: helix-turn-helix transcriptional regulator [Candidatus Onthoplasma faecigallinarum]|nr:helix-turn-helix transcriptional regulator [Candidatus Onthoplasma faecigallinarum]
MRNIHDVMDIFAERLLDLIRERGWSLNEFSNYIKIPRTTINGWTLKTRSPKVDSLCELADFFGVSVDYLLGRED